MEQKIKLSKEDYDFLKELQHELNTQTNDCNADPVYWGVMEKEIVAVPDGCGDPAIYMNDETMTLEEAVEYIENELSCEFSDDDAEAWKHTDKEDIDDVASFLADREDDVRVFYYEDREVLSWETGAFLTKRACQKYIENFGYNHRNPHTFAMTAYRNFELERLLKIIKTIDFE